MCPRKVTAVPLSRQPSEPLPVIAAGDPWLSLLGPDWLSSAQPIQGFSPGAFPWISSMGPALKHRNLDWEAEEVCLAGFPEACSGQALCQAPGPWWVLF